jgi:alpha-galactosidase
MLPLCRKIAQHRNADLQVTATLDRADALRGADFVVLSVAIGGLPAMQADVEIPEKYGIYHSVGDTVGPGGLSRAMRHVPFAVKVAREMEALCPEAWLLNLTNPMTAICRAVHKATPIRTVGLCHEVAGMHDHMAQFLQVPRDEIAYQVAGINHLPAFTRFTAGGRDGFALLRDWLAHHDPLERAAGQKISSAITTFVDTLAVKLLLFQQTGVLYAAGDRHVAEFFPGFLTRQARYGKRYGVFRTTMKHRRELLKTRTEATSYYRPPKTISSEEMAPLMAALLGGPSGRFTLNLPNRGQIANLAAEAVVECSVVADKDGLHPEEAGPLSHAAHAAIAPHVDRQEMLVDALLHEDADLARAALATDPMIADPRQVLPLFADLQAANQRVMASMDRRQAEKDRQRLAAEMAALNAQPVSRGFSDGPGFHVERNTLRELMEHDGARAVLARHLGPLLKHPQLPQGYDLTLRTIAGYVPFLLTKRKLRRIQADLERLEA